MTHTETMLKSLYNDIKTKDIVIWNDEYFKINFDDIELFEGLYIMMRKTFLRLHNVIVFDKKVDKNDLYSFVNFITLCRKMAKLVMRDAKFYNEKLRIKYGEKHYKFISAFYLSLITYLDYNDAKVYGDELLSDPNYKINTKKFSSFDELYKGCIMSLCT